MLGNDPFPANAPDVLRNAGRSGWLVFALLFVFVLLMSASAEAKVFASQNQALREAFPDATRIERDSRILLKKDFARVKAITKDDKPPKVVVLHTAWEDDTLLGFAHIDVHNVRSKPEAFMIVLTPDGVVRSVRVLAFHEPLDYLPTDRWYAQFEGKRRDARLRVGGDVHGVVGATLSAQAAADGVRRMLAYYEVLLQPGAIAGAPAQTSADGAPTPSPEEPPADGAPTPGAP